MDVCPRVSVLCCPVSVEALRRVDPLAKESYQMSLYVGTVVIWCPVFVNPR
jgi:hypothetical protein